MKLTIITIALAFLVACGGDNTTPPHYKASIERFWAISNMTVLPNTDHHFNSQQGTPNSGFFGLM